LTIFGFFTSDEEVDNPGDSQSELKKMIATQHCGHLARISPVLLRPLTATCGGEFILRGRFADANHSPSKANYNFTYLPVTRERSYEN
jgi:hypothetical protein